VIEIDTRMSILLAMIFGARSAKSADANENNDCDVAPSCWRAQKSYARFLVILLVGCVSAAPERPKFRVVQQ
jgi:hypothetical protein